MTSNHLASQIADFDTQHEAALRRIWLLGDVHGQFKYLERALVDASAPPAWLVFLDDVDIDYKPLREFLAPLHRRYSHLRVTVCGPEGLPLWPGAPNSLIRNERHEVRRFSSINSHRNGERGWYPELQRDSLGASRSPIRPWAVVIVCESAVGVGNVRAWPEAARVPDQLPTAEYVRIA